MINQTVGEIAAELPAAARVFEKYQIDYCCGGNRPLGEVCAERGLSADAVLAEVGEPSSAKERNWTEASLADLMDHIVRTHHEYLKSELPILAERLARVRTAHAEKHGERLSSLQAVFHGLSEEITAHLRKEEVILFPAILDLEAARAEGRRPVPRPFGPVANPIHMMVMEHDNAGAALSQMREITQGYALPADGCATFRALYRGLEQLEADLHRHIHLENNILFPRAVKL